MSPREKTVPSDESNKKPRLRKTAPTIRERAEAARVESENIKPKRLRTAVTRVGRPLKRVRLPDNKATRPVRKTGRGITKVAGWIMPSYFLNSWHEVRQVTWPGRKETWRLTGAVFIFAIVFGAMVTIIDKILNAIFRDVVLK